MELQRLARQSTAAGAAGGVAVKAKVDTRVVLDEHGHPLAEHSIVTAFFPEGYKLLIALEVIECPGAESLRTGYASTCRACARANCLVSLLLHYNKRVFTIAPTRSLAAEVMVYMAKAIKELDGYVTLFHQLRESNKSQLAANEIVFPLEVRACSSAMCSKQWIKQVPIDSLGEADGGGGASNKAAQEKAREKQREIERLNSELALLIATSPASYLRRPSAKRDSQHTTQFVRTNSGGVADTLTAAQLEAQLAADSSAIELELPAGASAGAGAGASASSASAASSATASSTTSSVV